MTSTVSTLAASVLKRCIEKLSDAPGVYRFYNEKKELLYVGKARNLKKRVASYLRKQQSTRVASIVSHIAHIEITITHNENDALLLESNLIKSLHPRYNVLLRDDKSYPYLIISAHKDYPRLHTYRGRSTKNTEAFGPYPNVLAMRDTLNLLQKLFKLRPCRDTFFKNRSRPCLQYQIQRCTAPCVGLISVEDYQHDVQKVRLLLEGKSQEVIRTLTQQMEAASATQHYEKAAQLLETMTALSNVQMQQAIINTKGGNIDLIAADQKLGLYGMYILTIREGQTLGGHAYFPTIPDGLEKSAILSQFVSQFYLKVAQAVPEQILVDSPIDDQVWLSKGLSKHHKTSVLIRHRLKKNERPWLALAQQNLGQALDQALQTHKFQQSQRYALQTALQLPRIPERLECFDISHSHGEATVASCVVFDAQGPAKKDYRRFTIKGMTPGDDYAALRQALTRRYSKTCATLPLPDVLIIDGGKAQLAQAASVLADLRLKETLYLMAIAKGPRRKPGEETLFFTDRQPLRLASDSPALLVLQQIRDEAHRFALSSHRKQRAVRRRSSVLDSIKGIGPKKRQQLLTYFGGLQGLRRATLNELQQVPGMTATVSERVMTFLKHHTVHATTHPNHENASTTDDKRH